MEPEHKYKKNTKRGKCFGDELQCNRTGCTYCTLHFAPCILQIAYCRVCNTMQSTFWTINTILGQSVCAQRGPPFRFDFVFTKCEKIFRLKLENSKMKLQSSENLEFNFLCNLLPSLMTFNFVNCGMYFKYNFGIFYFFLINFLALSLFF